MSASTLAPPSLHVRDALLARADQIGAVPLTLVVAPAGSGKSTLLSAWRQRLATRGDETLYLDLSPLHADAALFAADLLEIARHARADFGRNTTHALAQSAGEVDAWRVLARSWLRDATALAAPLVIFLDNFHAIPPDSEGARWLDELVRSRPVQLVFVLSSRGSIPPSAARLRTEGAIVEVGAADLSLRADEVAQLLASHGAGGDETLAARVLARTEGWATGVQLATRRLAQIEPARRERFIDQLGREPDLFGFVAAEVLRDEPADVWTVVEVVALLGRCAPADVAELLGEPGAARTVARAVDRGVLLSDGSEVWIHQLWRDFVTEHTTRHRSEEERRLLLRRAGELLRRQHRFESALGCFAEIGDWDSLARTMLDTADPWTREGRGERVRYWISRIPAALVDATPALLALRGFGSVRPAPYLALPDLERAMQMYRARGDRVQERALAGMVGMLYLAQLRRDDALRVLRRMISLRGVLTDPAERGGLYSLLAQRRYLTGRYAGAIAMARRAATMPLDALVDWFNAQLLAWLHSARGERDVALRELDRVLERPEVMRYPFLLNGARLHRARLLAVRGDATAALEEGERAEAGFRDHRMPMVREISALTIAHAKSLLGDRAAAREWYAEALRRAQEHGGAADGPARVQLALALAHWGEMAEAAREARRALDALAAGGDRLATLIPWLGAYAIWALSLGDPREAHALVHRHARTFEMPDLPLSHHTAQLALADVAERAGEHAEAERLARAAFEFAARHGVREVEPMIGEILTPIWSEWALRAGVCADYALERLAATEPARVAPLLADLAGDKSAEVRERAVRLLARRGGRTAFEPLRAASEDRVARVRELASAALAQLDLRPPFTLRVRSFDELAVWRGDEPVRTEDWKGNTARRLLARLLVAEGRALSREQIREDLWPDAEPEAGRNNLRVAVTRLNDALDPERPSGAAPFFVVAEGDALRLRMEAVAEWDVARFRTLLRDADEANDEAHTLAATRQALALYTDPLLAEIDDAWVQPLRRELAEHFAAAAQRSGPRLVRRGRLDLAGVLAEQMLRADPADEHGYALRMRVQLARRDRAGALRSYDEAVAALARELDLTPGAELQQLAAQARSAE